MLLSTFKGIHGFNQDMLLFLFKLFPTGDTRTTKRPTVIQFYDGGKDEVFHMHVAFGELVGEFGKDEATITQILAEACNSEDNLLYEKPLQLTLRGPGFPNIKYTDMPGLVADTSLAFADTGRTLVDVVTEVMVNPDNTLVVVEPATATTDLDNSRIIDLLQ
jgi:hypothetical protein